MVTHSQKKYIPVTICDTCGEEGNSFMARCPGCGDDICIDCRANLQGKKRWTHYNYRMTGNQTNLDGHFCQKCNDRPPKHAEELYKSYSALTYYREELGRRHKEELKQGEKLENKLEEALEKFNKRDDEAK